MAASEEVKFSLVINHTPWRKERRAAFDAMMRALDPLHERRVSDVWINDKDYRGTDWQVSKVEWALSQWVWAAGTTATHHLFLTDDLHISPRFWEVLEAMVRGSEAKAIGLLSNHWDGPRLYRAGCTGYRTKSWLVGPAYALERDLLAKFLPYFEAMPPGNERFGQRGYENDDSSLNTFICRYGYETFHPLPTIIEHRGDLDSTVGHGDRNSRERVSWRRWQRPYDTATDGSSFEWRGQDLGDDAFIARHVGKMADPKYWADAAPLLPVKDEPKGRTE